MKNYDRYFAVSPRIAKFNINSRIERFLGTRAATSEFWKRLYVSYYRMANPAYYRGGVQMAMKYVELHRSEVPGLSDKQLVRDMIYSLHRFGVLYSDYWIYGFALKNAYCRDAYISDKLMYHYDDILNGDRICHLMTDKLECYRTYGEFFARDLVGCNTETDYDNFRSFVDRHPDFIVKPIDGDCGRGTEIVKLSQSDSRRFFDERLKAGPFVVEELVEQGEEMARIHPQSVNTLRVFTFVIGSEVNILGVALRMGTGASCVDNAGAGGIYAPVDQETGIVTGPARDYFGHRHICHPDTGVQIVGFRLPEYDRAMELIRRMALTVEGATLIAWDIAYSRNGWVMIEGNTCGGWTLVQTDRGRKSELYACMDRYFASKR